MIDLLSTSSSLCPDRSRLCASCVLNTCLYVCLSVCFHCCSLNSLLYFLSSVLFSSPRQVLCVLFSYLLCCAPGACSVPHLLWWPLTTLLSRKRKKNHQAFFSPLLCIFHLFSASIFLPASIAPCSNAVTISLSASLSRHSSAPPFILFPFCLLFLLTSTPFFPPFPHPLSSSFSSPCCFPLFPLPVLLHA